MEDKKNKIRCIGALSIILIVPSFYMLNIYKDNLRKKQWIKKYSDDGVYKIVICTVGHIDDYDDVVELEITVVDTKCNSKKKFYTYVNLWKIKYRDNCSIDFKDKYLNIIFEAEEDNSKDQFRIYYSELR